MENNLRKHVLSDYAVMDETVVTTKATVEVASSENLAPNEFCVGFKEPTVLTENVENSDADEFMMIGNTQITRFAESKDLYGLVRGEPTGLTHAIEDSDPDEFGLEGMTLETRATETSDPDEMYMEPTKLTFTVEASDEDEFLLM